MRKRFVLVLLPTLVLNAGSALAQDISKQHSRGFGSVLLINQTPPPNQPPNPPPSGSSPGEEKDKKKEEEQKGKTEESGDKKQKRARVFLGYSSYSMSAFNEKLSSENNESIDGGLNAGVEFLAEIPVPKISGLFLPAIGFEYLEASSATTHPSGPAGSTNVDWELPVLGLFIAPEFTFKKDHRLYFRPVGVGYYTIGRVVEAKLAVSDRPGHLEISGSTVGATSRAGLRLSGKNTQLSLELGYRYLKFTNLTRTPKSGFTAAPGGSLIQPSSLPETLDYSGLNLTISLSLDVGGKG